MDAAQHQRDVVQVRAVAALGQEYRLALGVADARMIQIHVDHRLLSQLTADVALLKADQEGPARDDARNVVGEPATLLQKQVLVLPEAEQRDRMILAARGILSEEDRILALDVGVLGWKGEYGAHLVAEFARRSA